MEEIEADTAQWRKEERRRWVKTQAKRVNNSCLLASIIQVPVLDSYTYCAGTRGAIALGEGTNYNGQPSSFCGTKKAATRRSGRSGLVGPNSPET